MQLIIKQCDNYEVQRWCINKFNSAVSRIKSADRVKHSSHTVLPT